jgi:hypothetical protein
LFEDNLLFDEGLIRFTPLPEFLLNNDNIFPLSIINRYYPAIRNAGKIETSKKHKKSKKNNKKNTKKSKKTYTK